VKKCAINNIKKNLKVPYPLELNFTDTTDIEVSQDDIQILKLDNYSEFILSMLTPFPPFAHIDYKEALTEFYKKQVLSLALYRPDFTTISRVCELLTESYQSA